jgi:hypothetical protein
VETVSEESVSEESSRSRSLSVERRDDTVKGVTMGDPDGPFRFIETLGCEVPTYVDPRPDLVAVRLKPGSFKHVDYHVPFQLRADFRPEQWPLEYYQKVRGTVRVNSEGFTLCSAVAKATGQPCQGKAVNRTHFCRNHGGSLHPADKKLSVKTIGGADGVPQDRVDKLDRVQKFMQGFLPVEELDDDELTGNFVRTNAGNPIKGKALGIKFEQLMSKELHRRLNEYLKSKAPRMLEVMYEIADSDLVEPADRIKAAQWIAERVIGKTPEVLVHTTTEKPYEGILDNIQSGSREDYRKKVASSRPLELGDGSSSVLDVEVDDDSLGSDDEAFADMVEDSEHNGFYDNVSGSINNRSASQSEFVPEGFVESDDSFDDGDVVVVGGFEVLSKADDLSSKREEARNARDRLKKAKARRYAARAVGGTSSSDLPLLIEWIVISNVASPDFGKFKMRLILPNDITEAVVERVKRNNDPAVQAERLHAAAERLARRAGSSGGRGVA